MEGCHLFTTFIFYKSLDMCRAIVCCDFNFVSFKLLFSPTPLSDPSLPPLPVDQRPDEGTDVPKACPNKHSKLNLGPSIQQYIEELHHGI